MNNQDRILKEALRSGDCLTLDEMETFRSERSEGPASRHLLECAACAAELRMLEQFHAADISPDEADAVQWVQKRLRPPLPRRRSLGFRRLWAPVAICAGLAFGVLVFSSRHVSRSSVAFNHEPDVLRSDAISHLSPAGDLPEAPREFSWQGVSNASEYHVRLMRIDKSIVWETSARGARAGVPKLVQKEFLPYKTMIWQVTARNETGAEFRASDAVRVRVVPGK